MTQINLLKNYPITKRDLKVAAQQRTDHERSIARKFGMKHKDLGLLMAARF